MGLRFQKGDLVAIGFLIGQAIGRWGNFFNREAFGSVTQSFLRMGLENAVTGESISWEASGYVNKIAIQYVVK